MKSILTFDQWLTGNTINSKKLILEKYSKYDFIVVDVQPSYNKFIKFNITDLLKYIQINNFQNVLWFYNGPELGYKDNENIIQDWLIQANPDYEDLIYSFDYKEKIYGFFRELMDVLDEDQMIDLLKYMYKNNIDSIQDLSDYNIPTNINDIFKDLNFEDYSAYIPNEILDILKGNNNIQICGGGEKECLKEIEICLNILNIKYNKIKKFVY